MKVLIAGGAGFIGSNFVRYMLDKYPDVNVTVLDKLTYAGNEANLADCEDNPRYSFVQGDIADKEIVRGIVPGADAVVNFAAETHVDRSILFPEDFILTDVVGTFTLLEAVRDYKIPRYLQISTDEVYGSIDEGSFTEKSNLDPSSPYSASKAGGDLLTLAYSKTFKIPALITRSSNNYGLYQYPEKLIPLFITNIIEEKKLPVYGDGKQVRDWLYVMDNCSAIDKVLREGAEGEVYNVGGDNEYENIYVIRKLLELMDADESLIEYVTDRPAHDRRYSLDSSKTKELGWTPETGFDSGLEATVKWYLGNPDWWQPLKDGSYKEYYLEQYGKK
ncbi:MAG: dTDP-glucose 4,6-dehydratase [bacterium]|nr:dTDP-glucose 4,6-dehydratase [bacterium]